MKALRRRCLLAIVASLAVLTGCASVSSTQHSAARTLAPTGKLRVALYPGTPTSILGDPATDNAKGVGFDLGRELAKRAGVSFEPVVFANNAEVFAAAKAGSVDMVFTNATPVRRSDLDFSPTVLQVEQGYLVPSGSAIHALDQIDRTGVRVGVSEGSTSAATLSRELHNATVVRTASLQVAIVMLTTGELDAFATNKGALFEMSGDLSASRVLDGSWGLESFAIGIPKGRGAALPFVSDFVQEVKINGTVSRAVERAGLRGVVVPD